MESNTAKESIVSRLFGFKKKRKDGPAPPQTAKKAQMGREEEQGFATVDAEDEPSITVPEQVIRIRTHSLKRKDDAVHAISESFLELTKMLASVNERLDRQESRAVDLGEQLSDLPEYLRTLPRLHQEQNDALRAVATNLSLLPQAQEQNARAVEGLAGALEKIPHTMRENTAVQEQAIRKMAAAQAKTANVLHHGHQQTMRAFAQATQKSLRQQQHHMESVLVASQRAFKIAAVFTGVALLAVVAVLVFG